MVELTKSRCEARETRSVPKKIGVELPFPDSLYPSVFDNLRQGLFVFDSSVRLIAVNKAGQAILGQLVSPHDLDQTTADASLSGIFPDRVFVGWSDFLSSAAGHAAAGETRYMTARHADGERVFAVGIHRLECAAGQIGLIVSIEDVTTHNAVERKFSDLEKAIDKGLMGSSVAHDLNNFLGLVLGGVEIAEMSLAKGNLEKALRSLDKIKNNVGRMERFAGDLAAYAKPDAHKASADLNNLVADVLSFVPIKQKFGRIMIKADLDRSVPRFDIDTDQIAQLLLAILDNAADAIAAAAREDGLIVVTTSFVEGCACLRVTDNGVGMEAQPKERLFRAHFTTKPGCSGYGLVTCARIISNHFGRVNVESEPGKGTTFTFTFPLHPVEDNADSDED